MDMNSQTKKMLKRIEPLISSEKTVIYEGFQNKKRSLILHLWDMIFDELLSLKDIIDHRLYYLIASNDEGILVKISQNEIEETITIPHWSSDQRDNFKKVVIDQHIYRNVSKTNGFKYLM